MGILPSRPLLLDPVALGRERRRALLLLLLVGGVGAGFAAGALIWTQQILEERALWDRGVEGTITSFSGQERQTSKLGVTLLYDYDIKVEYLDAEGNPHQGRSEFELFWSPLERERDATLRYDPADPERFVLSSAIDAGLPRWGLVIMCTVLGGFMLLGAVAAIRNHRRRQRWLALCADDGEEVVAEVVSMTEQQGNFTVKYSLPEGGKPRSDTLAVAPLIVEREGKPHVILLRSPRDPESRIVIGMDFSPFAIDPETQLSVLERAAPKTA